MQKSFRVAARGSMLNGRDKVLKNRMELRKSLKYDCGAFNERERGFSL